MFNTFTQLPGYIQKSFLFGGCLGLVLAAVLYAQVDWYHDLVVWSWTNPWMYALGIPLGIALAIANDAE